MADENEQQTACKAGRDEQHCKCKQRREAAAAAEAAAANGFANILMPIMANIGNLSYVLTAILGSLLALFGTGGFTLGGIGTATFGAILLHALLHRGTREAKEARVTPV